MAIGLFCSELFDLLELFEPFFMLLTKVRCEPSPFSYFLLDFGGGQFLMSSIILFKIF